MNIEKNYRQTSIEIIRIICMFLILMSHCDDIFGLSNLYDSQFGTLYKTIDLILHAGGQMGVGCFVLITGYFSVEKIMDSKKTLRVAKQVWFYTISFLLFYLCINQFKNIGIGMIVNSIFPILTSHYWFATSYIILILLSPYINFLINELDKNNLKRMIIVLCIIFVIIDGGLPGTLPGVFEGRLGPLIIYYIIGGYIKKYVKTTKKPIFYLSITAIAYISLIFSIILINGIGIILNSRQISEQLYFYRQLNSPLVLIFSISLFLWGLSINIKHNSLINKIASCTFGVYLIHENQIFSNYVLKNIFQLYRLNNPLYIIVATILSILAIYIGCSIVDYARQKILMFFNRRCYKEIR